MKGLSSILVAAALTAACNVDFVPRGERRAGPRGEAAVSPAVRTSPPPDKPAPQVTPSPTLGPLGKLTIVIVDHNRRKPPDIPVNIEGPVSGSAVTDKSGRVTFSVPAGDYGVSVPAGCTPDVIVKFGSSGRAGVAPGKNGMGALRAEWVHRVGPGGVSRASEFPNWAQGRAIEVSYLVSDRCRNDAPARNAAFASFVYRTSANLEIIGNPVMRAGADGRAHLRVRCVERGGVSLIVHDNANPGDSSDLAFFAQGDMRAYCV